MPAPWADCVWTIADDTPSAHMCYGTYETILLSHERRCSFVTIGIIIIDAVLSSLSGAKFNTVDSHEVATFLALSSSPVQRWRTSVEKLRNG